MYRPAHASNIEASDRITALSENQAACIGLRSLITRMGRRNSKRRSMRKLHDATPPTNIAKKSLGLRLVFSENTSNPNKNSKSRSLLFAQPQNKTNQQGTRLAQAKCSCREPPGAFWKPSEFVSSCYLGLCHRHLQSAHEGLPLWLLGRKMGLHVWGDSKWRGFIDLSSTPRFLRLLF